MTTGKTVLEFVTARDRCSVPRYGSRTSSNYESTIDGMVRSIMQGLETEDPDLSRKIERQKRWWEEEVAQVLRA